MNFIDNIKIRAKSNKKTIVLPETMDERIIEAASRILDEDMANLILIGNIESIRNSFPNYPIDKAIVLDPSNSPLTDEFTNKLYDLRRDKGMTLEEARKLLLEDYMYFACMLVKTGAADGIVSGACHSTSNTLRPALQIIKNNSAYPFVSSFFLMETLEKDVYIFSDSGLVEYPSSDELADIAGSSAKSFKFLVGKEPIVSMLSYSTLGSAKSEYTEKVVSATSIAKNRYPEFKIDGEFQLDAAIVPDVALRKAPNNEVAGRSNVLIFPNIDAGNIGYKLVERFAHAKAYGPITQGMANPVNDLSRGSSVDEIIGVVAITAVQAQEK